MCTKGFLFFVAFSIWGCTSSDLTGADRDAIKSVMAEQAAAWNEGDIPGFMEAYADSACFITARERTCGRVAVTARYEMRYRVRKAMGKLEFDRIEVLGAGADHAWCTGAWRLTREQDTLSCEFSLFWMRTAQGWRILRDHTY